MKNINQLFIFFALCFSLQNTQAQNCLGGSNIVQGTAGMTYMKSIGNNRMVVAGTYYAPYLTTANLGGYSVSHRAGDLLTIYAAITDTNLNVIRLFNVIGFNKLGGSFNQTRVWDMNADAAGNIYFSGSYAQDTLVSYNNDTVYSDGYLEAFIIRCDTMGTTTLLKSCGTRLLGTNYKYQDQANAICSDPAGNIYFAVSGNGYIFTINNDTVNSTSTYNSVDYSDIYIVSLFADGSTRWIRNCGTPGKDDAAYDIAVNTQGEVAITGAVNGSNSTFQFGSLTHTYVYSQYGIQGFIGKLDSSGVPLWFSPIEVYYPTGPDVGAYCTGIDDAGYVYGSGYFDAWAVFNNDTITSSYPTSNYFSKYDNSGQTMFVKLGNIDTFYPYPIFMEVKNNRAIISGQSYTNQLQFGPYGQCCSMKSYVALYNTNGTVLWLRGAKNSSGSDVDLAMGTLNENGTAYVAGIVSGTAEIAPLQLNSSAGLGFAVKFGTVASNNVAVSITNTGSDTITCGYSTFLQRTISPAGASLTWWANNDTIPSPNTTTNFNATPKFTTLYVATAFYNGCTVSDSLTVYVTPLPANAGVDTSLCVGSGLELQGNTIFGASYQWAPIAAVDTANTAHTSFVSNQAQTMYYTVSRAGCTNTDTLHIDFTQAPQAAYTFSDNLLEISFVNTALNYDSLYWDFGDGTSDTAANPIHTYAQNGFYNACLHVYNACGTDSMCNEINLTVVGLNSVSQHINTIKTSHGFSIESNTIITEYALYDVTGKLLLQSKNATSNISPDFADMPHGCYFLKIATNNQLKTLKLIW